jgi:type IV secretory pathway VirB2 component (pilin)
MDKIKEFFNNKITKTVEFILIAICCGGLIFAGVTVEEVAKVPALVAGILGAISALITFITSIVKK